GNSGCQKATRFVAAVVIERSSVCTRWISLFYNCRVNRGPIDTGGRLHQNVMEGNPVVGYEVNWCIYPNVCSIYLHPTVGDESGPQCRCVILARWREQVRRLRKRGACHNRHKNQRVCESKHYENYLRD